MSPPLRYHPPMRLAPLLPLLTVALAACTRPDAPTPAAPPPDHTPLFIRDHAPPPTDCATCHGPDPCARCHRARPPADHHPGYAGPAHALDARLDPDRCATCHTGPLCGRCHPLM